MKKKGALALSLIIIVVVLVIGIGIGIFYFSGNQSNPQENGEAIEQGLNECNDLRSTLEKRNCYFELAIKEGHELCDELKGDVGSCYEALAIAKKDYTICALGKYSDENKDACMFSYVFSTSDYSVCNEVSSTDIKDGCYQVAATRTEDSSWCNKIEETSEKELCESFVNVLKIQE
jgi:hypothetical protein